MHRESHINNRQASHDRPQIPSLATVSFSIPERKEQPVAETDKIEEKRKLKEDTGQEKPAETSGRSVQGSKAMGVLRYLMDKAEHSAFYRYLLNRVLTFTIPFNKPHGIKINAISPESLRVELPYTRKNQNHLKGLHACALATVSEFSSGVLLLNHLDPTRYRIIMESLEMKYHKQGRTAVEARTELPVERVQKEVLDPLASGEVARIKMQAEVYDKSGAHVCTGITHWHIKEWNKTSAAK